MWSNVTVRQTCFTLYVSQPFHTFLVLSHFCKYVHVPYFGNLSCISQLLSTDLYMNPGRPGRPVCNKIHKKTFRPFLFVWELPKSEFFLCAHKGPHHLHMRLLRNQEVLLGGGGGGQWKPEAACFTSRKELLSPNVCVYPRVGVGVA